MEALPDATDLRSVHFQVSTDDPEVVVWLRQFPEEEWAARVTTALRVGVLALRQASGFIDREAIRQEGKDLTLSIEQKVTETVGTLVGPDSTLFHLLDPRRTDGLVAQMREAVDGELTENNAKVLAAFDLNQPESALSRLVNQIQQVQRAIRSDFTLDDPQSALSLMLRELGTTLADHEERNKKFREEVQKTLSDMAIRKEAEDRGTLHGAVFEDAVSDYVLKNATASGDVGRRTGNSVGTIKNCKVGDCTVEMGADSQFAGESMVIEAKEDASYDLKKALVEIDAGRRNRGADVGIFVFSRRTAPPYLSSLARHGRDIVVVWDAEDPTTDGYFDAALALARALIFEHHRGSGSAMTDIDFAALDRAIESVAKRASQLDDIRKSGETVENAGRSIVANVGIAQRDLATQVNTLREQVGLMRRAIAAEGS
jgi:gas vesicle protein